MQYRIFDPTGNITALVEEAVDVSRQPSVAADIMQKHSNVEQVGFVSLDGDLPALRMAGGEFCGNASMSAAALFALEQNLPLPTTVKLSVSGALEPVAVHLERREGEIFCAAVRMPPARSVQKQTFAFADVSDDLTAVRLDGISHILIEPESPFFALLADHSAAESAVRQWSEALNADGLGLMFVSGNSLTPLVFVPGCDTVFWETSCASGTAAAGMALAAETGEKIDRSFTEPGGTLRVVSDPSTRETWLHGSTKQI
ncbi:MAG: hypothetical protein IJI27_00650 [Oscillospiraceae bacterium]|nr:hypothetical protein [Oscillospiraceae bacterium]